MRIEKLFFIIIIGFLIGVVGYSAVFNDITHDEAYTWFIARFSLRGAMLMEDPIANNHILNTIFVMVFSDRIFGAQEWAVRIGALIGFGIYIYAAYKLVLFYFKDTIGRIAAFLLLFSNPYLIEFFSLARGYGLSIGLMLLSIYHFQNTKNKHYLQWSFGAAALGVYANFTLLSYYLCLLAVYFINIFLPLLKNKNVLALNFGLIFKTIQSIFKTVKPVLAITGILFIFISIPIYQLQTNGQLYYGGENGLWADTISSLAETFIYQAASEQTISAVMFAALGLFLLCLGLIFYKNSLHKIAINDIKHSPLLIFTLIFFVLWFLFAVLGAKLVIYRTALFLYPLFVTAILGTISSFESGKWYQKLRFIVLLPFALLLTSHTILQKNATLHAYRDWQSDAESERVYTELYKIHAAAAPKNDTLQLNIFWLHEITAIFYSEKHHKPIQILSHNKPDKPNFDKPYFIIEPQTYTFYKDSTNILYKGRYLWLLSKKDKHF